MRGEDHGLQAQPAGDRGYFGSPQAVPLRRIREINEDYVVSELVHTQDAQSWSQFTITTRQEFNKKWRPDL